jgi:hypothetical protein
MADSRHVSRRAMAAALTRAALRLDERATALDERMAHWRKDRHRDDSPVVARTCTKSPTSFGDGRGNA